jgi:N-acylneuraminate cytidylyltransferase
MVIAFVPLRGGSKRIPGKNIKDFCGKPLCYWTLKQLQETDEVNKIVVSTDDDGFKEIILSFNFSKVQIHNRSTESALDTSSTEECLLEYVFSSDNSFYDILLLCQVTNPFLTQEDIKKIIQLYKETGKSVVTCSRFNRFIWNDNGTPVNYDPFNRVRSQEFKGLLVENGACYASSIFEICFYRNRITEHVVIYEMPEYAVLDIDTEEDFYHAQDLFKKHIKE